MSAATICPEWPKQPPTAEEFIRYCAARGLWMSGRSWGLVDAGCFDSDDELLRMKHLSAAVQMIHHHDTVLLLQTLRDLDPQVADEMADRLWRAADAGDSYGEWLWQWTSEASLDADAVHAEGEASAAPDIGRDGVPS